MQIWAADISLTGSRRRNGAPAGRSRPARSRGSGRSANSAGVLSGCWSDHHVEGTLHPGDVCEPRSGAVEVDRVLHVQLIGIAGRGKPGLWGVWGETRLLCVGRTDCYCSAALGGLMARRGLRRACLCAARPAPKQALSANDHAHL